MPAGPAPQVKYWSALKELGEKLNLGDSSGRGVMALLDLQGRIADELKPDYLLIDARTGITELGGLATTILADTVVCMLAANQESLDGTVTVVEALKAAPRPKRKKPIRIVPVLSRASQPPGDERFANGVERLLELTHRKKAKSKEAAKPTQPQRKSEAKQELFALPHDDAMAASERVVGGEQKASIQAFTDRLLRRLRDPNLLAAFEKLSEYQPKAYRRWSAMRTLPLEELRVLLLRARASATALGLPAVIDAE